MFKYRDYQEMLNYIDPASTSYQEWTRVGMALKYELNDYGLELWDTWSAQDTARYTSGECSKKWASFKNGGITGKTLYKMASENGYQKFRIDRTGKEEFDWNDFIENDRPYTKRMKITETKKSGQTPEHTTKYINNNITESTEPNEENSKLIEALISQNGIFKQFIAESQIALFNDPEAQTELRGLNADTLARYKIGYTTNYSSKYKDKKTGEIRSFTISRGLVIPGSFSGYAIRNLDKTTKDKNKYLKPSKEVYPEAIDIPTGLFQVIQEPNKINPITGYREPVFVCEGYLDTPSLYQAGADAISLNGTGTQNTDKIIYALKYFKVDRPLILALDNDKAGRKGQQDAYLKFQKSGIEVYKVDPGQIYGNFKDANDCLIEEPEEFSKRVKQAKDIPNAEFESKLNKNQLESFKNYLDNSLQYPPIPTGFSLLDSENYLDGGLYPGLYIMGALSSTGKTTLMLQIADNIAKSGTPVLYISLEMLSHELRAKSISRYTYEGTIERNISDYHAKTVRGILDKRRYANYSEEDIELLEESGEEYFTDTGDNLVILERRDNHVTVDSIEQEIAEFKRQIGRAPAVFIDYLQILDRSERFKASMTDKQVVDENVKQLKRLAVNYNIPVFTISSFNRESYNLPVSMSSFKESGAIEYSSDVLIGLEPVYIITDPMFNQRSSKEQANLIKEAKQRERDHFIETGKRRLALKILKNRNGKANQEIEFEYTVKFNHYREFTINEWKKEIEKEAQERNDLAEADKTVKSLLEKMNKQKKTKSAIPSGLLD